MGYLIVLRSPADFLDGHILAFAVQAITGGLTELKPHIFFIIATFRDIAV